MRVTLSGARIAAVLAGALLASACGSDDEASAEEFCDGAVEFVEDGTALADPTSQAATEARDRARDLDPPGEIADEWQTLLDGAEVLGDMDPSGSEDLPPEVETMAAASTNVFRYLAEECGARLDAGLPGE